MGFYLQWRRERTTADISHGDSNSTTKYYWCSHTHSTTINQSYNTHTQLPSKQRCSACILWAQKYAAVNKLNSCLQKNLILSPFYQLRVICCLKQHYLQLELRDFRNRPNNHEAKYKNKWNEINAIFKSIFALSPRKINGNNNSSFKLLLEGGRDGNGTIWALLRQKAISCSSTTQGDIRTKGDLKVNSANLINMLEIWY